MEWVVSVQEAHVRRPLLRTVDLSQAQRVADRLEREGWPTTMEVRPKKERAMAMAMAMMLTRHEGEALRILDNAGNATRIVVQYIGAGEVRLSLDVDPGMTVQREEEVEALRVAEHGATVGT